MFSTRQSLQSPSSWNLTFPELINKQVIHSIATAESRTIYKPANLQGNTSKWDPKTLDQKK